MSEQDLRHDSGQVGTHDEMRTLQERLETRLRQAEAEKEALRTHLEARVAAAEAARDAMLRSWSWRITAPLRVVTGPMLGPTSLLRRGAATVAAGGVTLCRRPLAWAMSWVLARPQLSERINRWLLDHFPKLHARLFDAAATAGLVDRNLEDAEHPGGSQAAHSGFSEFVPGFLSLSGGERLLPTLRRVGRFHGSQPEQRLSAFAGIHLDHELIHALQTASVVQSRSYDPVADAVCGRQLVRHVYLALLRRYPARVDENRCLNRLANGAPIEAVIEGIRKSAEYQSIVRWA